MLAVRTTTEELLAYLVAFDTTSRNSNLDLIAFVRDYLAAFGIESVIVPSEAGDKASLFATIGPAGVGGVCLSGHSDVVPVDGQPWSTDPFTLTPDGRPGVWARRLRHEGVPGLLPRHGAADGGGAAGDADPSAGVL